jgi:hypothetical protein
VIVCCGRKQLTIYVRAEGRFATWDEYYLRDVYRDSVVRPIDSDGDGINDHPLTDLGMGAVDPDSEAHMALPADEGGTLQSESVTSKTPSCSRPVSNTALLAFPVGDHGPSGFDLRILELAEHHRHGDLHHDGVEKEAHGRYACRDLKLAP